MDPSILLIRAAAREPGALEQWLASTYGEAYARLGGDEEALLVVYQTMLDHHDEITPKIKFWPWFDRIVGPSKARERAENAPPEVLQRLTQALSGYQAQANRSKGVGRRMSRWVINGWLTAYAVSFTTVFFLFPQLVVLLFVDLGGVPLWARILFSAILAVPASTAASICLLPVFGPWRQRMTSSQFPAVSAVLSVVLGTWLVLSFIALAVAILSWQHPTQIYLTTAQVLDGLPWPWALALACGLVGSAASIRARDLWQSQRWVNFSGDGMGPRLLAFVSLLPCFWVVYLAGVLILDGSHLDPGLVKRFGAEKSSLSSNVLLSDLPLSYQETLNADQWSAGQERPYEQILNIRQAWFEEMDRLDQRPRFWEDPVVIAMARFANDAKFAEFSDPKFLEAGQIEVGLRRGMILGGEDDKFGKVLNQLAKIIKVRQALWERWLSVAILRDDLYEGVGLNSPAVSRMFIEQWQHIEALEADGNDFQAMIVRRSLNEAWKDLQKSLPGPPVSHPRTPKERAVLLSETKNLTPGDPEGFGSLTQATLDEEDRRRDLAVAIIVLEARRLKATGQPIPSNWDGFRPEVARLGHTYSDWLKLVRSPEGVTLAALDSAQKTTQRYEVWRR